MMVCYQLVAKQINYEMKMTSDRIIPEDREMFVRHIRLGMTPLLLNMNSTIQSMEYLNMEYTV